MMDLLHQIGQKGSDKEKIADKVKKKPELVSVVVNGLGAKQASVKYGCGKVIRIISEKHPEALYSHIDTFINLLDSDKNILKWEGIHVLGNLAIIDNNNKIDAILDKYLTPISGPVLITAANVISGAAKIATAKPNLVERITTQLLKVEHAEYKTSECRNVAFGQIIDSFDQFFDLIENKEPVIGFVKKQSTNTRSSTSKRAVIFLKRRQLHNRRLLI